ncbi:F0F1 ATP synthase subunit gamma [Rhodobacter lacus]|uniref:ATP synthase gamma chain n=1 Tax=Rhodobacter lacus TaxID=1641972 RepID=A0ABW5A6N3_9RHOB
MPSLKDLKNRIVSVKNTRKITKAMQMVAAAKLRRAQESAEAARPYAEQMSAVLSSLATAVGSNEGAPRLLAGTGSEQVQLLVVMTGERGLCGGFNANIAKLARTRAHELIAQGKTVKILTVGKKGRDALRRDLGDYFIGHVDLSEVKKLTYATAQGIADDILARFEAGEFDVATIFYSTFQSVISQTPTAQQIVPAQIEAAETGASTVYDYEPGDQEILTALLPRGVATAIFAALLENNASFNGAQMTAMDNATRNAGDMIDRLTIEFNRSRQAAITKELIEIISGAEAL